MIWYARTRALSDTITPNKTSKTLLPQQVNSFQWISDRTMHYCDAQVQEKKKHSSTFNAESAV